MWKGEEKSKVHCSKSWIYMGSSLRPLQTNATSLVKQRLFCLCRSSLRAGPTNTATSSTFDIIIFLLSSQTKRPLHIQLCSLLHYHSHTHSSHRFTLSLSFNKKMTVANAATKHCKKAMKMGLSLFCRTFNSSKWWISILFLFWIKSILFFFTFFFVCVCSKTMAKMTVARIKLLRNKREVVVRQMRRDIAMLLESHQDATARIRVLFFHFRI